MIRKKLTPKEESCLERVYLYAEKALSGRDGSHDFAHAERVLGNCLRMCEREEELTGVKVDYLVIGISCLVHDIEDSKYAGDVKEHGKTPLEEYLTHLEHITSLQSNAILFVIRNLGFRNELDRKKYEETLREAPPEFFLIQDADRLDAIGAVGIARCFMFSGSRGGALSNEHDHQQWVAWNETGDGNVDERPTISKEEYQKKKATAIGHFFEKLLTLKERMLTKSGRERAAVLHDRMVEYLSWFFDETYFA